MSRLDKKYLMCVLDNVPNSCFKNSSKYFFKCLLKNIIMCYNKIIKLKQRRTKHMKELTPALFHEELDYFFTVEGNDLTAIHNEQVHNIVTTYAPSEWRDNLLETLQYCYLTLLEMEAQGDTNND